MLYEIEYEIDRYQLVGKFLMMEVILVMFNLKILLVFINFMECTEQYFFSDYKK